jgi:hypothetical protein
MPIAVDHTRAGNPVLQIVTLSFLNHLRRILIVSLADKFGMSQMISPGPFQKTESPNDKLGIEPDRGPS